MSITFSARRLFWAFLAALLFLLVFSWSTSPLYLTYGGDSPFFQIIGLGVTQGKIPYVDLFDHKGPVPFFMDALGYSTGMGRCGIFILQVISMTITLLLLYRIAALFVESDRKRYNALALTLIPLADFIVEGNQVEEWQLPYIALALLMVCRYIVSGVRPHEAWRSLIYGLCFGMVFYNRPNDGVMWVGSLFFGLFLLWIVRKDYRMIWGNIAAFIAGFVVITIPILAYFSAHDALDDMYFGMIIHNIRYAGDALLTWGGIGMILIPAVMVCTILYLGRQGGLRDLRFVLIPMLVLTIILIGKRDYYHYLIPLTPFIVICFGLCQRYSCKKFLWVVCSLFVVFSYTECRFIIKAFSLRGTLTEFYAQTDALYENVPEEERNTIWNYNLVSYDKDKSPHLVSLMGTFPHKGITPSSPVLAAYDLEYLEERFGIRTNEPKWLVMYPEDSYNKDFDYIYENYELVAFTPSEPVCEIRLYRRKSND